MNTCYTVEAHGKLLLFGEYLALFDLGACGIPLPMYMKAQYIRTHKEESLEIVSHNEAIPSDFYTHLARVYRDYGIQPLTGRITIDSEIPLSAGFGSSAAFCVCIAKIIVKENPQLLSSVHTDLESAQLQLTWSIAHSVECFFHYTASGIDTALALYPHPLLLMKDDSKDDSTRESTTPSHLRAIPYKQLSSILSLENLIIAYTPRTTTPQGNAVKLLSQKIQSYVHTHNKNVVLWKTYHNDIMTILQREALGESSMPPDELLELVGTYAQRIHRELSQVKITGDVTNAILTFLQAQGILGGKMSGAGLGGAFYIITKNRHQKNRIMRDLKEYICEKNIDCHIVL